MYKTSLHCFELTKNQCSDVLCIVYCIPEDDPEGSKRVPVEVLIIKCSAFSLCLLCLHNPMQGHATHIAVVFVRLLEILEWSPCPNNRLFIFFVFIGRGSRGIWTIILGVPPRKKFENYWSNPTISSSTFSEFKFCHYHVPVKSRSDVLCCVETGASCLERDR
jgi:hypothetical protein